MLLARQSKLVTIQVTCLCVATITLLGGFIHFQSVPSWFKAQTSLDRPEEILELPPAQPEIIEPNIDGITTDLDRITETPDIPNETNDASGIEAGEGQQEEQLENEEDSMHSFPKTHQYVQAILDPTNSDIVKLQCPDLDTARYGYLQAQAAADRPSSEELKYFFALDLTHVVDLLPRLVGSIVDAIRFLGPSVCALSIVEGHSQGDGTRDVLVALEPKLKELGIRYYLNTNEIDSRAGNRINKLADLRNMALAPMLLQDAPLELAAMPAETLPPATGDTTIIFLNDVAACPADILELVHQRIFQKAHMTCGMDWTSSENHDPCFYDAWVARSLKGDTFFEVPPSGDWSHSWDLFWNDVEARERMVKKLPFQVFACWNGGVAFGAGPFLGLSPPTYTEPESVPASNETLPELNKSGDGLIEKIAFRSRTLGECQMGEPTLLAKDLWFSGYGRIAVVPTVNFEYSDEAGKLLKEVKGFAAQLGAQENLEDAAIEWQDEPPERIKCMPTWARQTWVPWNQSLPLPPKG
ncbi:alpha-1,3-mannosyltransferase CMT1 [Xylariaceae sp. FL0016]|nr:alpha-1,3-mannosyltransferase CMT1 [Xylariaceae sp. FL0016]